MKTIKFLILSILIVSQVSCIDTQKIDDDFTLTVDTEFFKGMATVQMVDPANPENLEGNNVLSVEVLGKDKDKIVTNLGDDISKLKVVDGIINIAVNPNTASSADPVSVILKVSGTNYLTTTIPVTIGPEEIVDFEAIIVNKENPVEGIEREVVTFPIDNGVSNSMIEIATQAIINTKVVIDNETEFQDINGNSIPGSEIKIELTNFSSTNVNSLAAFPGGFSPQAVKDENGDVLDDVAFVTAGFISIDMFVGGTEVKNFSKPIKIIMDIDSDLINPETSEKIKTGDIIPIWSYSKDDGQWDYHGDAVVTVNGGKLQVEFTTTHLSWYNLDFYGRRCSRWRGAGSPVTLNISLPGINSSNSYRLVSTFVYEGTNQPVSYYATKTKAWYDGQTFELNNAPAGRKLQMVVYSGSSRYNLGEELLRSLPFDACGGGQVNIDASSMLSNLPPPPVTVHVKFSGTCGSTVLKPYTRLYMYTQTSYGYSYWQNMGYTYNGEIYLRNIELNKEYQFRIYYNGQRYEQNITFDKTEYIYNNFEIPKAYCDMLIKQVVN